MFPSGKSLGLGGNVCKLAVTRRTSGMLLLTMVTSHGMLTGVLKTNTNSPALKCLNKRSMVAPNGARKI